MEELDLEELKIEATDLGIKYSPNIGAEKLKSKIDEYYESQETSEKEIIATVVAKEKSEVKSAESDTVQAPGTSIAEIKAAANKTKVVTIIDNDQRVNNQTTSCKVNCSNMYFDLGTATLPLNMAVEVRQGHINVLKEVRIPQHTKDNVTGLSVTRMVPRYTISYEQI